jgi:hypothetical protein
MVDERRKMQLVAARTSVSGGVRASSVGWERPSCRHCPKYQADFEAQALNPFLGHIMMRRDTPTAVHRAVAKRSYATYCDFLQALTVDGSTRNTGDAGQIATRWAARLRLTSDRAQRTPAGAPSSPKLSAGDRGSSSRWWQTAGLAAPASEVPESSPTSLSRQSVGHAQRKAQLKRADDVSATSLQ